MQDLEFKNNLNIILEWRCRYTFRRLWQDITDLGIDDTNISLYEFRKILSRVIVRRLQPDLNMEEEWTNEVACETEQFEMFEK